MEKERARMTGPTLAPAGDKLETVKLPRRISDMLTLETARSGIDRQALILLALCDYLTLLGYE